MASDAADDSELLELLEFVDSWTPDASLSARLEESSGSSTARMDSDSGSSGTSKRRRQNREVDARRRLKKKREREELKLSVEELTERLKRLQHGQQPNNQVSSLITATADNKALRSRLAINAAVISALQDALSPDLTNLELDASVMADAIERQRATLKEMLATNKLVFERFPPLLGSPFLLRSEIKVDSTGCPRFELSSAVEIDGNLPQVAMLLRFGLKGTPPFWGTVCNCIESERKIAEGVYALGDRVLDFQKSNLRSIGLVQKHQQLDSYMDVMWSSEIFHLSANVSIISRTRLRITAISSSRTLIQGFNELFAHDLSTSSMVTAASSIQTKAVQSALVRAFGQRLATKQRVMLKILFQSTGRDDIASLVA